MPPEERDPAFLWDMREAARVSDSEVIVYEYILGLAIVNILDK